MLQSVKKVREYRFFTMSLFFGFQSKVALLKEFGGACLAMVFDLEVAAVQKPVSFSNRIMRFFS